MLKIAIIGPESTGKTELCKLLAQYFRGIWEPEYARTYVENLTSEYTYKDVVKIAKHQIEVEDNYTKCKNEHQYIFFDTELIITKIWFEYKYKQVPDFLQKRLQKKFFDLYLLCYPDLEWEYDPVRENSDNRKFFFNWYKKEIEQLNIPYAIIKGSGDHRTNNAIQAIKIFESTHHKNTY